ncbi:hypothetical protein LOTGIDRAFT_170031 [Lottia gigantea]|uniref:Glycosyltransferase family 92 protein n=1 Tax=Lottia gigantea TaxID=225164 RepID=V4B292_LOTGI|nr:hypothetical protein LOTGIDRAFT_170031 [Lottia gigantea]ESO82404.1 hypothetical protein LOTGIDRAFT_170031 [Lottia gigantea]
MVRYRGYPGHILLTENSEDSTEKVLAYTRKIQNPNQPRLYPLKVPGLELYIYSAIPASRTTEGLDVRITAVNGEPYNPSVQCCFQFESGEIIIVDAMWKFHFGMGDYKSTVYSCKSLASEIPSVVSVSRNCSRTEGASVVVTRAEQPTGVLSVCVHAVYGYVNPELIVEWMEMLLLQGVQRVFVYPLNHTNMVDPRTLRALQYYSNRGLVTILPYTLTAYDKNPNRFQKTDGQMFSDEILPVYDCLSRSSKYTFTAIIDFDEFIIPESSPLHLLPVLDKLYKDYPNSAYFSLTIQNFVMNWTEMHKSDLIILRYLNRTHGLHDRVKLIHVQPRYHNVGMHTADLIKGYTRRKVSHSIVSVHHYTYCRNRWTTELCLRRFARYHDVGLLQVESQLRDRVNRVPKTLRHG